MQGLVNNEFNRNARDIWNDIGSKREFSHWIKYQIEKYYLKKGGDYLTKNVKYANFDGLSKGKIEYFITDAAARIILEDAKIDKEKSMEFRKIHDEKTQRMKSFIDNIKTNPVEFFETMLSFARSDREKEQKLQLLLVDKDKHFTSTQVGQEIGLSAKSLNNLLRSLGFIYYQSGTWIGTHKIKDKEYLVSKETLITDNRSFYHTYFTESGRLWVLENYNKWVEKKRLAG